MKIENNNLSLIQLGKDVLLNYNIISKSLNIIQNNGLKTLWKFTHNNQTMCLKRLRQTKENAIFSVNAQVYIFNNGGNVPRVYLNTQGSPITEHMGQIFVLYEWINGRDLNFERPSDLHVGLEGLAKFHKISRGYTPPEDGSISFELGKLPNHYEDMINKMLTWKKIAEINLQNSSSRTYLKYIYFILKISNEALNQLLKSSYDILTDINFRESSLSHQDYGTGNAVLSDKGVYVIDLDGVAYDSPIRDLRKIIVKRMKKHGKWEKNILETILQWYEKNNKLSPEEKEVLKIDLLFPHKFFGISKNLFLKNKIVKAEKITKIAMLEQSKVSILEQWI